MGQSPHLEPEVCSINSDEPVFKVHILITLPWSGRVLLWLGMGRCIITENSWLTSPLPPKRLNDREVRVGWYDRKEPGFGIREPRFNSQPNHWGYTSLQTMFSSLHNDDNTHYIWSLSAHLSSLGNMSTWGSTHTGRTLPAVAHSGKYLASIVSPPEDEEASKIFQNILTEPQHA